VFVEALRRYLGTLSDTAGGWLSGLRDPMVGRALALLHADPAQPWTLDALARAAGTSRAVLAARFTERVGCPPMQYLTRWRMQCAALRLDEPGARVGPIAHAVGYGSEAAFCRAFKKAAGQSPAAWRSRARGGAT
jgi:AraC-like DNA-binding protein